jgi:hypothetical protein
MKPSKLYEALHALIGERVPLHIWGACGVGKSQIVAQVADDLDYEFLDVRAVQLDPVDLRGLPRIAAEQTEWVPPKFLPTYGKGILFLDELTSAPQMTQAGCYQLVLDRKLGEYVLPDGWVVIAAGNPASERGVHFAMPRPLRNRFVHLELEAGTIGLRASGAGAADERGADTGGTGGEVVFQLASHRVPAGGGTMAATAEAMRVPVEFSVKRLDDAKGWQKRVLQEDPKDPEAAYTVRGGPPADRRRDRANGCGRGEF